MAILVSIDSASCVVNRYESGGAHVRKTHHVQVEKEQFKQIEARDIQSFRCYPHADFRVKTIFDYARNPQMSEMPEPPSAA